MSLFGNDDDEYDQQPQEKSFLSKVGSFLWNAVKIIAVIALAVLSLGALFKYSDTARDFANKHLGGMGSTLAGTYGKVEDKVKEGANFVGTKIEEGLEKLGLLTPKKEGPNIGEIGAGVAGVAGAGYVAKKVYNARSNALGTVDEAGKFTPASNAEIKAAQDLVKDQERLKTLKEGLEKSEEKAARLRADAEAAKKVGEGRNKLDPRKLIDKRKATLTEEAAVAAEKNVEKLHKSITILESKIEKSTVKPLDQYVTQKEAKVAVKNVQTHTPPAGVTVPPAGATTPPAGAATGTANAATVAESATSVAGKGINIGGMWESTKAFAKSLLAPAAKILAPAGGVAVAYTGGEHATELWNHKDKNGEYDKRGSAVMQGIGTGAESIGMAVLPVPIIGPLVAAGGTIIKDNLYVANTLVTGKQNLTRSSAADLAGILGLDRAADYALDGIYGEKYDSAKIAANHAEEAKRIEAGLTPEQKNILKAWNEQVKVNNLTVDPLALIEHVKRREWEMPPAISNPNISAKR